MVAFATLLLAAMNTGCSQAPAHEPYRISMIHDWPMADSYVFKEGGLWHVYGTQDYCLKGAKLAPGKLKEVPYTLEYPAGNRPAGVWGFHPFKLNDGTWHGVGTLHLGYFKTEVASFDPAPGQKWLPGSPITRWRLKKVLVPYEEGKMATYETKVCRESGGQLYLVCCRSFGLGRDVSIVAYKMNGPADLDASVEPTVLLAPEGYQSEYRNEGAPLQIVEGPNIVEVNGYYLLLYTVGDFATTNYKAGFAYSKSFLPPKGKTYQKVLIEDKNKVWGGRTKFEVQYLVQSQHKDWPNYVGDQVAGPGLLNLMQEDGKWYLVFHGYVPTGKDRYDASQRMMWKAEVTVNVSDKTPPTEWIKLVK